jgi:hypothetical protein
LIERCDGLTTDTDDTIPDTKAGFPSWRLIRHIDDRQAESSTLDRFDDKAEVPTTGNSLGDLAVPQEAIAEDLWRGFRGSRGGRGWRWVWRDFARGNHDRGFGPSRRGAAWILGDR